MFIKTSDINSIKPFLKHIHLPKPNSHKGQNGRVLVIGGSSLFHAASIWAAEIASHIVDMVHYSSTIENNKIFFSLKKKYLSGMVIGQKDIPEYIEEEDAVLLGPGMVRGRLNEKLKIKNEKFSDVVEIKNEASYTYYLTKYLLENYPNKKFVIDAGSLQMMNPQWLLNMKIKPIITPHQGEFEKLFGWSVRRYSVDEKADMVQKQAKKYNCVILLKAINDFISDGERTIVVAGGNAGLTKGGTGDILAGLTVAFFAKSNPLYSAIISSFLLKKTAEELFLQKGYWYNTNDVIEFVPIILKKIFLK